MDSNSDKPRRVLRILRLLTSIISANLQTIINAIEQDFPGTSMRTIQRDLALLRDEGYIKLVRHGRETEWVIVKADIPTNVPSKLESNELLSFYMLKAYLNTFKGTKIEQSIAHLTERLEAYAPGEAFLDQEMYWDQNFGNYNYSEKNDIIEQLLKYICDKLWIKIDYLKAGQEQSNEYLVLPESLYSYRGTLYLVAYDYAKHRFSNYILHQIIKITESEIQTMRKKSNKQFNMDEFKKQRFAVYDGEPKKVTLRIKKEFKHYFENRNWHETQKFSYKPTTDELLLRLKVPESPDFISWIISWGEAITVEEPMSLRYKIEDIIKKIQQNYEK